MIKKVDLWAFIKKNNKQTQKNNKQTQKKNTSLDNKKKKNDLWPLKVQT